MQTNMKGLTKILFDPKTNVLLLEFDTHDNRADFVENCVPKFAVGEMMFSKPSNIVAQCRIWFDLTKQKNPLILNYERGN